jgi:hypothetical protein
MTVRDYIHIGYTSGNALFSGSVGLSMDSHQMASLCSTELVGRARQWLAQPQQRDIVVHVVYYDTGSKRAVGNISGDQQEQLELRQRQQRGSITVLHMVYGRP